MKLRAQAQETMTHVVDASRKVTETTGVASVVLVAVAAVAILALVVGIAALAKAGR